MENKWPVVTFVLITINLAVFLFTWDMSKNQIRDEVVNEFGLTPQFLAYKPYTIITHMFLHADIVHFGGNMLMLAIVGLVAEEKIGSTKFALFYFLSGLCTIPFGFLMEFMTNTIVTLLGASGAIYGVMFLAATVAGWEEVPGILIPILNFIVIPIDLFTLKNIKVPMFVAMLFYFLMNFITMFYDLPYSIGELAHFGGLIGGLLGVLVILPEKFK